MKRAAVGCAAIVAIAIAASCKSPTQITLEITTDVVCSDVRGTTITVGDLDTLEDKPVTTSTPVCANGRIGSIVIVPSGAKDGLVAIKVVLGVGKDPADCLPPAYGPGCIVARRALHYISGASLLVPIPMAKVCTGIPCNATQTCVGGDCSSATIDDPSICEAPEGCGEAALGPRSPPDAGPPEAGPINASPCGDTSASPANCGACGHSCRGAKCTAGVCEPDVLMTGLSNPTALTVDATHAYVAEEFSGDLSRVALNAPGVRLLVYATGQAPHAIRVAGTKVFWVDQGAIGFHDTSNGSTSTANVGGGRSLVLGGGRLFYATEATNNVESRDLALQNPLTHATAQTSIRGLALNSTHVYWANTFGTIGRELLGGGAGATVISGETGAISIAADDAFVYWTADTSVKRAPIGAFAPIATLADGQSGATSLVLDGGTLYWSDNNHGAIRSVPAAGGAVTTLSTTAPQNTAYPYVQLVALDAQYVYWISSQSGTLARAAR